MHHFESLAQKAPEADFSMFLTSALNCSNSDVTSNEEVGPRSDNFYKATLTNNSEN